MREVITVGEYKEIISRIKEIINGKNILMFNHGYYGEGLAPLVRWMVSTTTGKVFKMPIDSKDNYFDQESIDMALGMFSIGFR